jgi:hypothetical protein
VLCGLEKKLGYTKKAPATWPKLTHKMFLYGGPPKKQQTYSQNKDFEKIEICLKMCLGSVDRLVTGIALGFAQRACCESLLVSHTAMMLLCHLVKGQFFFVLVIKTSNYN